MFGLRHCGPGYWATGRHGRGGWGRGFGREGGSSGMGGGGMLRLGRMLAQGDLRLIALSLIAEQPRHGYEIIKLLEEKTGGYYSPSPGIVYPTLTYLEEAGYVTAQTEGSKKLYTITDEGRGYLEQNRDFVDDILGRLGMIAERVAQWRNGGRERGSHDRGGPRVSRMVDAAIDNLRDVAAERFKGDREAEARIVELLARTASELRKA